MFGFRDSAVGLDVDIERRECYNRGNLSEVAGEGSGWRAMCSYVVGIITSDCSTCLRPVAVSAKFDSVSPFVEVQCCPVQPEI